MGLPADPITGEVLTDAEVIEVFSEEEAQRHVDKMRGSVQLTAELILEAWERRIWKPLGHKNWESFIDQEFPGVGLNPAARQVLMIGLRNAGMSQRQIAMTTGASRNTVAKQVAQIEPPAEVEGADGKTYKATTRTTESTTVEFAGEGPGGDEPAPPSPATPEPEPMREVPSDDPAEVEASPSQPSAGSPLIEPIEARDDIARDAIALLGRSVALMEGNDDQVWRRSYLTQTWEYALGVIADHPELTAQELSDIACAALRTRSVHIESETP
jgi:DNA-binding transcriptional MocR family regulator